MSVLGTGGRGPTSHWEPFWEKSCPELHWTRADENLCLEPSRGRGKERIWGLTPGGCWREGRKEMRITGGCRGEFEDSKGPERVQGSAGNLGHQGRREMRRHWVERPASLGGNTEARKDRVFVLSQEMGSRRWETGTRWGLTSSRRDRDQVGIGDEDELAMGWADDRIVFGVKDWFGVALVGVGLGDTPCRKTVL